MKQKLGLACTLVRSPDLLLLDEPSVGVDPLSRRELWVIVQQLVDDEHLSVLVSTAYMDEAERCAQVFVHASGADLSEGTPATLRTRAQALTFTATPPPGSRARAPPGAPVRCAPTSCSTPCRKAAPSASSASRTLLTSAVDALLAAALSRAASGGARRRVHDDAAPAATRRRHAALRRADSQPPARGAAPARINRPSWCAISCASFGDFTAVASTSFDVRRGEIFGLLGPNGAGKTTTFRMLCGLLPATSGHLEVAGVNLRTRARAGPGAHRLRLAEVRALRRT